MRIIKHLKKHYKKYIAGVGVAAIAVAVGTHRGNFPQPSPTPIATQSAQPSGCHENGGLPDMSCTPGVAAETSAQVICNRTTGGIRPPVSYTNNLKTQQIQQYHYSDINPADYEEDHMIPLELGGSPTDPKNLWPEPRRTIASPGQGAEDKDQIENLLHKRVCSGQITLQEAQKEISTNWEGVK